jgi:hypothetical protein
MFAQVTDIETGCTTIYDLSWDNWRRYPACMRNGLVVMWWPDGVPTQPGMIYRTSGRRWQVLERRPTPPDDAPLTV